MCEFYDHDTMMAREKELTEALNAGANPSELIEKLETELIAATAAGDISAALMAEDLQAYVLVAEIVPQTVSV